MNVTEGSVKYWLSITSYSSDNNNNVNNSISNNSSSATSDINQDSPTSQLWDLRWFALLSGPLLFGTIILPLITGPTIRYMCQAYVRLRVFSRFGFLLLATLDGLFTLILGVSGFRLILMKMIWVKLALEVTFLAIFIYRRLYAWQVERRQVIWLHRASLALLLSLIVTDVFLIISNCRDGATFFGILSTVACVVLMTIWAGEVWINRLKARK